MKSTLPELERRQTVLILSDIHYASAGEKLRLDQEVSVIKNPLLRYPVMLFRRYVWLRDPLAKNHLLDEFIERAGTADWVIANGDYSCDSAFTGVSDNAAFESTEKCLEKLRQNFSPNFRAVLGDHELGKKSLFGNNGGMRLASFHRAENELGLEPFWRVEIGNYLLLGVVSSLLALPIFKPDILPEEFDEWTRLREIHLTKIREAFGNLQPEQKVILFCHDPTALPFLWQEKIVRDKLDQVEWTIIGHLHSPLILWKSGWLAGFPAIGFLGNSVRRYSRALRDARLWQKFHVQLCPSLAGIELLKDGGYLTVEIDPTARQPANVARHRIRR